MMDFHGLYWTIDGNDFSVVHSTKQQQQQLNWTELQLTEKTEMNSKRKQFRYGYYYIIIVNRICV